MTNTQTPVTGNTPQPTITPEVGKRYVTRGGWVTPEVEINQDSKTNKEYPLKAGGTNFTVDGRFFRAITDHPLDFIAEYVEPTAPPDTFRRDLVASLYVAMVASIVYQHTPYPKVAKEAILLADTLIKAMEGEV